jgi:hypothetical protein
MAVSLYEARFSYEDKCECKSIENGSTYMNVSNKVLVQWYSGWSVGKVFFISLT